MISYKELGLVNTREMFAKAIEGGYAIPAFNFNNMEQLQAIISAAAETKSPVIFQVIHYSIAFFTHLRSYLSCAAGPKTIKDSVKTALEIEDIRTPAII